MCPMADRRLHLQLEVDLDGEPICGKVGLADAPPHGFTGYASLIATLQSLRAECRAAGSPARRGNDPASDSVLR